MPFMDNTMALQCKANQIHRVSGHGGDVNRVTFGPYSLASCSCDKTVRLWKLDDFAELLPSPLCGHTYTVHCCNFSPFGTLLASCSTDGKCILWDGKTGTKLNVLEHPQKKSIRVCKFSPNSDMLATGSDDQNLCIWDVASRRLIRTYEGHDAAVICCAFSPNSAFIVSGSTSGDLRIWDAVHGHTRQLYLDLAAHDLGVTCCEFSPTYGAAGSQDQHGQLIYLLATCGNDNLVKLWHFHCYLGSADVKLNLRTILRGHSSPMMDLCFSPNGRLLATASGDKTVRLWDPKHGTCIQVIEAHSRYVTSCAFSTHGDLLATGSNDRYIGIWKISYDNKVVEPTPKSAEDWTADDVCNWVCELNMSQYVENFRRNAIDGTELLALTVDIMEKNLGIGPYGHRKKIIRAMQNIHAHPIIQKKDSDEGLPDEYLCPITREVMHDPVIAADGYTYERAAIMSWVNAGKQRSPMTNAVLTDTSLTPNRNVKMLIQKHASTSS